MENKFNFIHITFISLIAALLFSYGYEIFQNGEIVFTEYIKVFGISAVIAILIGFSGSILYLYYKQMVKETFSEHQQQGKYVTTAGPGIHYYYNNYEKGFSIVEKVIIGHDLQVKSEFNFIDMKGKILSDKWFDAVSNFNDFGTAIIFDRGMYNLINREGKIISLQWFCDIDEPSSDGISKVKWNNNEVNFIDKSGKLLWDEWKPEIVLENKEEQ